MQGGKLMPEKLATVSRLAVKMQKDYLVGVFIAPVLLEGQSSVHMKMKIS